MNFVDRIFKLAERFARKISLAQQSAQSGEIANVLQAAGLWDKSAEVSPMLTQAGVDDGPILINFVVDKGLNVKFNVSATPSVAAIKLEALLKNKYSVSMRSALVAAKTVISDTVEVKWLKF
jgi:hypothetical protein